MERRLVIGVDFGSASVRAVICDDSDGRILTESSAKYPRYAQGMYLDKSRSVFRQHPLDYLESFEKCVCGAVGHLLPEERKMIRAIGVDTTGSTPAPVNREGIPLALLEDYKDDPDAMFYMWKDHSASGEARELNDLFSGTGHPDYCKYQGNYSAEWFWAKILHAVRSNEKIRENAYTWVEHCDWMVGLLTGNTNPESMYHSACAAGHKALWNSEWNGLPGRDVLAEADPYLGLVYDRYGKAPQSAYVRTGTITKKWAEKLGLPKDTVIAGSSFDAHAGAVGAGIEEHTLVATIGTSAVDMLIARREELERADIRRFCGQAENSIVPGYIGIETGQAAFGDLFEWLIKFLEWPLGLLKKNVSEDLFEKASDIYEKNLLSVFQNMSDDISEFPIVLDWFNGRRYPDTDDEARGTIDGISLGTMPPDLYKGIAFAAVAGLKRIVDGLEKAGLEINTIKAVGGISKKSDVVMQMMSDLLEKDIVVLESDQTCALGAAIYAASSLDEEKKFGESVKRMESRPFRVYHPEQEKAAVYQALYEKYLALAAKME